MGMPVRLSEELTMLAKEAAEAATRSLTAQVEHWALIGRAVERALDHASLSALKTSGGKLAATVRDPAQRAELTAAIRGAVEGMSRDALRHRIHADNGVLYGIERSTGKMVMHYAIPTESITLPVGEKAPRYSTAKRRKRA